MTMTQETKNMELISHHNLNGFSNGGEGVAFQQLGDGRRIWLKGGLYIMEMSI